MISKIIPPSTHFGRTCQYILGKSGAYILAADGVRVHNSRHMAEDFQAQADLRPTISRPCFHAVLSFPPGEIVSDELMEELARKYQDGIGMVETQFVIVRHNDTPHAHMHIVVNRVNYHGKAISDSMIRRRGKTVAQNLTREYHLHPAEKKYLVQSKQGSLSGPERIRHQIFTAISASLKGCTSLDELIRRLKVRGIETVIKFRSGTEEPQGISFRMGNVCFKGSVVDRKFSLANLQKEISSHPRMDQWRGNTFKKIPLEHSSPNTSFVKVAIPVIELISVMSNLLYELLKPVYDSYQVSHELLREPKRKKRRKRL